MPDLSPETIQMGLGLVIALSAGGMIYMLALPFFSGDRQATKRIQGVTENKSVRTARRAKADEANNRRKHVADTLKSLEDREKAKQKVTLRLKLQRAGLDISTNMYWVCSIVGGLILGITTFVSAPNLHFSVPVAVVFVGIFGLPPWVVGFLTRRRHAKFLAEFANAIDIIVRGVKSGLPLNECLKIISTESPSPIREEFQEVIEQQRVGVPLSECFERMIVRLPLSEVKFFGIVIGIQQQAGGNLSEALGNLSGVLRDRKKMHMKVKALSSEAKASAWVLGSLPFIVTTLIYMASPDYIAPLFKTKMGNFILGCAGFWMFIGMMIMRKMVNFKF
jgi:tight adherence protein B